MSPGYGKHDLNPERDKLLLQTSFHNGTMLFIFDIVSTRVEIRYVFQCHSVFDIWEVLNSRFRFDPKNPLFIFLMKLKLHFELRWVEFYLPFSSSLVFFIWLVLPLVMLIYLLNACTPVIAMGTPVPSLFARIVTPVVSL